MRNSMADRPRVVLAVLDGFGINFDAEGNAVAAANLPTFDMLDRNYPMVALQASGIAVGLPWGEVGNSEVGHQTIGSGLVVYQSLPRISLSIEDGSFFENEAILRSTAHVKEQKSNLHILGILSDGGVHGHIDHLFAMLELAKREGIKNVYVHAITDGRDVPPQTALQYLEQLESKMKELKIGQLATIAGRFNTMDRADNWDRIEAAYDNMTMGSGTHATHYKDAIEAAYSDGQSDEKLQPICIVDKKDVPVGLIQNGDACVFMNFREDRARQIAKALALPTFAKFERPKRLEDFELITMTEYEANLPVRVAFPPQIITTPLAKVLSDRKLRHLHVAESEKYAHVTYFFNGGREEPFDGEERKIVPSPKTDSFDTTPAMSAPEVTQTFLEEFLPNDYVFGVLNYSNADMVGHTGNIDATIEALQIVDAEIWKLLEPLLADGVHVFITADHGNAETMIHGTTKKSEHSHSNNPVPLWYVTPTNHRERSEEEIFATKSQAVGFLGDVAPTILDVFDMQQPPEMTGRSLLPNLQ